MKRTAPGTPGFHRDTAGTYDISVQNNFAEHGTTLAWGSKGRNILISGNIARYMDDLAYDTEGGENVVISNNISVNSACAGIGCYFYGERVLIANNQVLVFEEGAEKQRGNFIRLHSAANPTTSATARYWSPATSSSPKPPRPAPSASKPRGKSSSRATPSATAGSPPSTAMPSAS